MFLLPGILTGCIALIPRMLLWQVLLSQGVEADMGLGQVLSYTYMSQLLGDLLVVQTFASAWNYEGKLSGLFARPMSVFGQIIAQTMGGWGPMLLFFTVPMLLLGPALGVQVIPASLWFFPSLLLCVSLGFAIDFIFVCVTIRLRGMAWLGYSIRMAITWLLSGAVIPFSMFPFGLQKVLEVQPFGSLGGAALSVFVGVGQPVETVLIQLFWNVVLWTVAILWFHRSQERMVSFGG